MAQNLETMEIDTTAALEIRKESVEQAYENFKDVLNDMLPQDVFSKTFIRDDNGGPYVAVGLPPRAGVHSENAKALIAAFESYPQHLKVEIADRALINGQLITALTVRLLPEGRVIWSHLAEGDKTHPTCVLPIRFQNMLLKYNSGLGDARKDSIACCEILKSVLIKALCPILTLYASDASPAKELASGIQVVKQGTDAVVGAHLVLSASVVHNLAKRYNNTSKKTKITLAAIEAALIQTLEPYDISLPAGRLSRYSDLSMEDIPVIINMRVSRPTIMGRQEFENDVAINLPLAFQVQTRTITKEEAASRYSNTLGFALSAGQSGTPKPFYVPQTTVSPEDREINFLRAINGRDRLDQTKLNFPLVRDYIELYTDKDNFDLLLYCPLLARSRYVIKQHVTTGIPSPFLEAVSTAQPEMLFLLLQTLRRYGITTVEQVQDKMTQIAKTNGTQNYHVATCIMDRLYSPFASAPYQAKLDRISDTLGLLRYYLSWNLNLTVQYNTTNEDADMFLELPVQETHTVGTGFQFLTHFQQGAQTSQIEQSFSGFQTYFYGFSDTITTLQRLHDSTPLLPSACHLVAEYVSDTAMPVSKMVNTILKDAAYLEQPVQTVWVPQFTQRTIYIPKKTPEKPPKKEGYVRSPFSATLMGFNWKQLP